MSGSTPANGDLLMFFVQKKGGKAIEAESTSSLNGSDDLTKDFVAGRYFQADNFSFGMKLVDNDGAHGAGVTQVAAAAGGGPATGLGPGTRGAAVPAATAATGAATAAGGDGKFRKWRALQLGAKSGKPLYPAKPNDISITRMIDSSSPHLLSSCLSNEPFSQAVLVKRSRIGTTGVLAAIMRIELGTVRLKSIEWDDNDAVMESCKLSFDTVTITYVSRKPDGTVASQWGCKWSKPSKEGANGG